MDLENIVIPLVEDHRTLPDRDQVLVRFREALYERLERGAEAAAAAAAATPAVHEEDPEPRRGSVFDLPAVSEAVSPGLLDGWGDEEETADGSEDAEE